MEKFKEGQLIVYCNGDTLRFLPTKKYEVWSGKVVEIGKMLGGWLKSVNGQPKT